MHRAEKRPHDDDGLGGSQAFELAHWRQSIRTWLEEGMPRKRRHDESVSSRTIGTLPKELTPSPTVRKEPGSLGAVRFATRRQDLAGNEGGTVECPFGPPRSAGIPSRWPTKVAADGQAQGRARSEATERESLPSR
jgi:hypothetical protein